MLVNILIALITILLIVGVFVYSYFQNKDEEKPKVNFWREFFNHFGDTWNYRR